MGWYCADASNRAASVKTSQTFLFHDGLEDRAEGCILKSTIGLNLGLYRICREWHCPISNTSSRSRQSRPVQWDVLFPFIAPSSLNRPHPSFVYPKPSHVSRHLPCQCTQIAPPEACNPLFLHCSCNAINGTFVVFAPAALDLSLESAFDELYRRQNAG